MHLKDVENLDPVPLTMIFEYLSTSIGLGIILMIIAVWSSRQIGNVLGSKHGALKNSKMLPKFESVSNNIAVSDAALIEADSVSEEIPKVSYAELLLGSANVLFLCFGMTGIMILVNNNLARAFAIGAAIAVIRFRIKFNSQGSMLFFGVLVGMACGVGQLATAMGITFAYAALQGIVIGLMTLASKKELIK